MSTITPSGVYFPRQTACCCPGSSVGGELPADSRKSLHLPPETKNTSFLTVGQRSAGPSFIQGVGGSIPALVDVSLSKTLHPECLPVAALQCLSATGLKLLWIKASATLSVY